MGSESSPIKPKLGKSLVKIGCKVLSVTEFCFHLVPFSSTYKILSSSYQKGSIRVLNNKFHKHQLTFIVGNCGGIECLKVSNQNMGKSIQSFNNFGVFKSVILIDDIGNLGSKLNTKQVCKNSPYVLDYILQFRIIKMKSTKILTD